MRSPTGFASSADDDASPSQADVASAVWDLVWTGHVTNDGLAPLRAWLGSGSTAHRTRAAAPRGRPCVRGSACAQRCSWRVTPAPVRPARTQRCRERWPVVAAARARARPDAPRARAGRQLLDRHGILTRAVAPAEGIGARFTDVYRVLSAPWSRADRCAAATSSSGSAGSQFALPGAVDRLRVDAQVVERSADTDGPTDLQVVVLAATDPANPYGAALAVAGRGSRTRTDAGTGRHRPGRKAGALVVLVDGALVLYLERGGRTVLSFTADPAVLAAAADGLADDRPHAPHRPPHHRTRRRRRRPRSGPARTGSGRRS